MGGSQQDLEEDARAAACVAADPVFSALDASGAPIIAASGDPLRIAFLNDPARAVFGEDAGALAERLFRGDDPGPRRLAELVGELRRRPGLRLERLRFRAFRRRRKRSPFSAAASPRKAATVSLSRRLACARIRQLRTGARPTLRLKRGSATRRRPSAAALRRDTALVRRAFCGRPTRQGRFTDVTHTLADVVGEKAADILGRSVQDATQALTLDAAFARAVASRRAWSGVEVEWPLEGDAGCVPTTLGALQMTDSAGRFLGYQGYGVLHIDRGRVAEPAAATASGSSSEENSFEPSLDNVVMLRAPASARVDVERRSVRANAWRLTKSRGRSRKAISSSPQRRPPRRRSPSLTSKRRRRVAISSSSRRARSKAPWRSRARSKKSLRGRSPRARCLARLSTSRARRLRSWRPTG